MTAEPMDKGNGFWLYTPGAGPLSQIPGLPPYEIRLLGHYSWTNTLYNWDQLGEWMQQLIHVAEDFFTEHTSIPKEAMGCDFRSTSYLPHLCCLDFYHLTQRLRIQQATPARPDLQVAQGGWHPERPCMLCGKTGGHEADCRRAFLVVNADTQSWEIGPAVSFDQWGDVVRIDNIATPNHMNDAVGYLTQRLVERAEYALNPTLFVNPQTSFIQPTAQFTRYQSPPPKRSSRGRQIAALTKAVDLAKARGDFREADRLTAELQKLR